MSPSKTKPSYFVAGHRGLVGSAVVRALQRRQETLILTRTRAELDLRDQSAVVAFFRREKPTRVFLAAAKVGGIFANSTYPADFILENLQVQTNVISAAFDAGVEKFVFLGSSCIYPKHSVQPITETALMSGALEPTNAPYAVAKIAGLETCRAIAKQHGKHFIALMPTNLYGLNDNYHPENSHVIPGLIRRFHLAKQIGASTVTAWGSGAPLREFLNADDLADACLVAMERSRPGDVINVGSGEEISIRELTYLVAKVVGYRGDIAWDVSKADGTPRKLLDSSRMHALGWKARIALDDGLAIAYEDFVTQHVHGGAIGNQSRSYSDSSGNDLLSSV